MQFRLQVLQNSEFRSYPPHPFGLRDVWQSRLWNKVVMCFGQADAWPQIITRVDQIWMHKFSCACFSEGVASLASLPKLASMFTSCEVFWPSAQAGTPWPVDYTRWPVFAHQSPTGSQRTHISHLVATLVRYSSRTLACLVSVLVAVQYLVEHQVVSI